MHRNVTAIYPTREVAARVRRALEDIGVSRADIHVIPDSAGDGTSVAAPGGRIAGTGTGVAAPAGAAAPAREHPLHHANFLEAGADDDPAHPVHVDRLHDLHLPEEDLRTYQQSIRRGDVVVSVEVDEAKVASVQDVMRHPDAHDIDHRASEFRSHDLISHSAGDGHRPDDDLRARRMAPHEEDSHARTYERNRRLMMRGE